MREIDSIRLDRARIAKAGKTGAGLYRFIQRAWPVVEEARYVDNWHIEEIAEHLAAVSRGEISRLVTNIPPGTAKSLIHSVFWPVWDAIVDSWRKWLYASHDLALSQRDALRAKNLIASEWFQKRWGVPATSELEDYGLAPVFVLSSAKNAIQETSTIYHLSGGGFRFSTSVEGKATGWHSHVQVVDDPTKPSAIQGGGVAALNDLTAVRQWWSSTMATRHADPTQFARVLIMQRLHELDLAQECIERGYVHLCLPMRFDPDRRCRTIVGGDRRTEPGELLFPARFPELAVQTIEGELGKSVAEAQLQQNPAPLGGSVFLAEFFDENDPDRWYDELPAALLFQSWDTAGTGKSTSDKWAGQVWAFDGACAYLVSLECMEQLSYNEGKARLRRTSELWPLAYKKLVENKSTGQPLEDDLRDEIGGIVLVEPEGDKLARANACTALFEKSKRYGVRVKWPRNMTPEQRKMFIAYRQNMLRFPKVANDDDIDATTQALLHVFGNPSQRMKRAMDAIAAEARAA